jgi:thiol-disulfide isomerase/thioredoxin
MITIKQIRSLFFIGLIISFSCFKSDKEKKYLSSQLKICFLKSDSFNYGDTSEKPDQNILSICDCIIGSYINDFMLRPINGDPFMLYSIQKPIFLFLFAKWCGPCMAERPAINDLAEKYSNKIEFIGISLDKAIDLDKYHLSYSQKIKMISARDDKPKLQKWFLKNFSNYPKMLPIPTVYLINSKKKILDLIVGAAVLYNKTPQVISSPIDFTKPVIIQITNDSVNRINIQNLGRGIQLLLNNN